MNKITAIMLGDVSGSAGLGALFLGLSGFIKETKADIVVCNGENSAGGFGISPDEYYRMKECGVSVVTSGNHIWQKDAIYPLLDSEETLLRPANYPAKDVPGHGYTIFDTGKYKIGVINLQGRVFMPQTDCPFRTGLSIVEKIRKQTNLILVDFHAEESSEKEALAYCLDGKVSVVAGTHTHVQTADAMILPGGTGYITDLGLTGVQHRIIGSDVNLAIQRQVTQLPIKSAVAEGKGVLQGVVVTLDADSGSCLSIEPFTR